MSASCVEPLGPTVKTDIPGPQSKQLFEELNKYQVNILDDHENTFCLDYY